jgi:hypothetical protein
MNIIFFYQTSTIKSTREMMKMEENEELCVSIAQKKKKKKKNLPNKHI